MRRVAFPFTLGLLILGGVFSLSAQDISQQAYLKASNTDSGDEFASVIALSGDTLVVGAPTEDSASTESDNTASAAGAVYVFTRSAGVWTQQAYLKASNLEAGDRFGQSVAISGDTMIVGANGEDGAGNSALGSGAAYIFTRTGGVWTQQAYLKASNLEAGDAFGTSVTIAGDTVVIGAISEDSDGTPANNNASGSGAAYVFTRSAGAWSQQAYLKASTPGASDQFGFSVSLAGETLVIGANQEDSPAIGVNGDETANTAGNSGAAYVFTRNTGAWTQEAYLKASNTGASDQFGFAVSIAGDLIAISAPQEASNAIGINGSQTNNSATGAGAVYLFRRDAGTWSQEAYVKASNTAASDTFGQSIALRGEVLAVGAMGEDSNATGFNGSQTNNIAPNSGAAYIFEKLTGTWSQQAYLKASNTEASDQFGRSITLSGRTAVVGANLEDSSAGAAYAFIHVGTPGAEPELDVVQPLGDLVADEGSVVDYGLVAVGAPAVTKTFHLFNRGTADLLISSVIASGDFVVNTNGMTSTVAAGSSTTFTVSFTPTSTGQSTATLTIANNDSDESPYEITLTGAALPEIAITGNTVNIVDGDTLPAIADHTDFSTVEVVGGTRARTFRITNTGVADLALGTITVSGDFAVTSTPASPVSPGGFTTFEITFDPTLIGLRTGEVSFTNNDGNENPFTFAIQGLGTGPGLADTTFDTDGRVITDFSGKDERARSLVVQSDGKIVVAGYADNGLDTDIAVARYLTNGSLDPSFGTGGIVTTPIGNSFDEATGIALQSDGKIIVCGFAYNGSNDDFVVLRYLTNGTLDTSFGGDGIVTSTLGGSDDRAYGVAVQSNGRIVLVGSAHTGSNADVALVRYLTNGNLDAGFGSGGKVTTAIGISDDLGYAIALQRDGKLVVTGQADNGISDDLILLRYNTTGSLDSTFGTGGKVVTPTGISNSAGFSVGVRRSGQIIVGGYTTNPTDTDWLIVRYLSNGSLDPSYGTGGKVIAPVGSSYEEINSVVVQADGSVLAAGFTRVVNTDDIALMRFLPNGNLDTSFGANGKVITALGTSGDYAFAMGVQTDGRIVVTGHTNNGNNDDIALVRYVASPVVLPPQIIVEDAANLELPGGSTLDFGSVLVGDISSIITVGIINDGTQPLNLSAVTKVGALAADYTVDISGMSTSLGAGASTSFTVSFSPLSLGTRAITLNIDSNDSDEPLYIMQLTGIGVATTPEIALAGDPDFTSVNVGSSLTRTFTISNEGTAPLLLPAGVIINGGGSAFTVSRQPELTSLTVGGSVEFDVTFTPTGSGLRQAEVSIANNDGNENPTTLAIQGIGIGAPEIAVEHSAGVALTTSISSVDFDSVTVGTGLSSRTFTVRNLGTDDLFISDVALSGGNVGDFELSTTSTAATIVPGGSTTFTVSFFTTALTTRSTSLRITNGDANESPFIIALTGLGVAAEPVIVLSGLGQTITDGDITPINSDGTYFGSVSLGDSVTRTFTITNSGTADLHITGTAPNFIDISGDGFFVSNAPDASFIAPGQSLTFDVTFQPSTPGPLNGIVTIANDDADHTPFEFHLGGLGVGSPELDVEQPVGIAVADEGSVVDYGLVAIGAPAVTKTFTLFNRGTANLTISSVTAGGDFVVNTSGMTSTVAASSSTTFTVSFTPTSTGQSSTTLTIANNDSDEAPYEITLVGAALPDISITGNTVNIVNGDTLPSTTDHTDFSTAEVVGGTRTRVFRITNTGTADLILGSVTVSGDFAVTSTPTSPVAPGGFTTFEITFDPTQIGLRTAEVSFTNNDSNESPFTFAIQGIGTGPGLTDTTFDTDGRVQTDISGNDERARSLAMQSDGKIVVAGYADNGLDTDIAVARYLTDGSLDPNFGSAGIVTTPIGSSFDEATGIALQSDGKIVVCGFAYNGSNDDFVVVRYLTNGTLDPSFGTDGKVTTALGASDDRAFGVVVQTNGRIVLVGSAHTGSNADIALVRYLTNGSLDASFGSGGKVTTAIGAGDDFGYAIALQRDGKLVVTGQSDNGISDDLILLRYTTTGSLDTTFGSNGKVVTPSGISNSAGFSVAVRRNGHIIVGGYTTNPTDTDWLVARYLSNGSLDPSYGTGGKVIAPVGSSYEEINSVVVQADGSVLAAGFTRNGTTDDIAVMRFLSNGSVDTSFGNAGKVITPLGGAGDYAFAMGVQNDGRIVVTGHTFNGSDDDFALVRYVASPVLLPPEIVVEEPAYTELLNGTATRDFGTVMVGQTSAALRFIVTNDGTEPLTLSSITKTGSAASDYMLDISQVSTLLVGGAETTFSVTFNPNVSRQRPATILIASSDSDENPFIISFNGEGSNSAPTAIVLSAASIPENNLANAAVGTITTTDADVADTHIFSLVAGDGDADNASFSILGNTLRITPSANYEVKNSYSVRIRATDNGAGSLFFEEAFVITITDVSQEFVVHAGADTSATRLIDGQTGVSGFGHTPQGTSKTRSFTIANTSGTLSVTGITAPAGFSILNPPSAPIAAAATHTFHLRLDAGDIGFFAGSVHIISDDPDDVDFDFPVSGQVIHATQPTVTVTDFARAGTGGTQISGAAAGTTLYQFGGAPALNASGAAAYSSVIRHPDGTLHHAMLAGSPATILVQDTTDMSAMPTFGDTLPANTKFLNFRSPLISPSGRVAFVADLTGTGLNSSNRRGVFTNVADGTMRMLMRQGGLDPATGSTFSAVGVVALAGDGVIFTANTIDGKTGLYGYDPVEGVDLLFRTGSVIGSGGSNKTVSTFSILATTGYTPGQGQEHVEDALNPGDRLTTLACTFTDGSTGVIKGRFNSTVGSYSGFDETYAEKGRLIDFAAGADAALPLAKFENGFNKPGWDQTGTYYGFMGYLMRGIAGVNDYTDAALFVDLDPEQLVMQVREGSAVTGITGATYKDFYSLMVGGGDFEFAFLADMRGTGITAANDLCIFAKHTTLGIIQVAREGGAAAGVSGGLFQNLNQMALPGDGQPILNATLALGSGGVTTSNDNGLWVMNGLGELRLAVREGDVFTLGGSPRTVTTIQSLSPGSSAAVGARIFTADGTLKIQVGFSDGTQGYIEVLVP